MKYNRKLEFNDSDTDLIRRYRNFGTPDDPEYKPRRPARLRRQILAARRPGGELE